MTFQMRDAVGAWQPLPRVVDYDDPVWATTLRQEQTPYGGTWVDGLNRPGLGRVTVRVFVSCATRALCEAVSNDVMTLLLTGTAFRDSGRSTDYLRTAGVLGEPKFTEYRGGVARAIAVTLALLDPYWHAADDDGSTALFPVSAGDGSSGGGTDPGTGTGTPQWGNLWT